MPTSEITMHEVRKIEVVSAYPENGNSRELRISSDYGTMAITLYGDTDVLDLLPRSSDFVVYTKPEAA